MFYWFFEHTNWMEGKQNDTLFTQLLNDLIIYLKYGVFNKDKSWENIAVNFVSGVFSVHVVSIKCKY